jgi:four helix bundle protein
MEDNVIKEKSFNFALRIVKLSRYLKEEQQEYVLSKQVLRSETAIGALVRESQHAESKADFIHKLSIALKETNETEYWIELLFQSGYLEEKSYHSIHTDVEELLKLLISIVKTIKTKS